MSLLQIGKVLKSNGTDGGLLMGFRDIDLEDIDLEEPVYITFDGLPVPFFIQSLSRKGTDKAIVHLNDIVDLKDAEEVVGQAVYADYLEEESDDEGFEDLIGWTLVGAGEITDFVDIPANPCLEVRTTRGEVLVPLHEDLIRSLDPGRREIVMDIPEGLLDL